jgi:hypothetical protein
MLCAGALRSEAQAPLGPRFQVDSGAVYQVVPYGVTMDGAGNAAVLWLSSDGPPVPGPTGGNRTRLLLRRYSPSGMPGLQRLVGQDTGVYYDAALDGDPLGSLVALWSQPLQIAARRFGGPSGLRQLALYDSPPPAPQAVDVAVDRAGGFVAVWTINQFSIDLETFVGIVLAQRFDASGAKVGPQFRVDTKDGGFKSPARVAISPQTGNFVVVWEDTVTDDSDATISGQRFSPNGRKLGSEFLVNTRPIHTDHRTRIGLDVAADGPGNFVVVWEGDVAFGLLGKRFAASGGKLGSEFTVGRSASEFHSVAGDTRGDFVATWQADSAIWFRLFCADGRPATRPLRVIDGTFNNNANPYVAFSDNGTFLVVWDNAYPGASARHVLGQRYSATACGATP